MAAQAMQQMLNLDKSKAIWCATSRHQHQLPTDAIPITGIQTTPEHSVREPGIYINADLSMWVHVKQAALRCFAALHQLCQIHRAVPTAMFQLLVVALVH